jgi:hypothetical protein
MQILGEAYFLPGNKHFNYSLANHQGGTQLFSEAHTHGDLQLVKKLLARGSGPSELS